MANDEFLIGKSKEPSDIIMKREQFTNIVRKMQNCQNKLSELMKKQ